MQRIDHTNLTDSKMSVAYVGPEKTGKTHNAMSWPQPIVCCQSDLNDETAKGFIREGRDIILLRPETWNQFQNEFVAPVRNRQFEAATVVIDSYTFLSQLLELMVTGGDPGRAIAIKDWGLIKGIHFQTMRDLLSATRPLPGKPSYNIVVTAHLGDVSDDTGNVLRQTPALSGAFKDAFGRCFGSVFLTDSEVQVVRDAKGIVTDRKPRYWVWTVPPHARVKCGDGVGGKGGLRALPPTLEGTYPSLCAAWGLKPEDNRPKE